MLHGKNIGIIIMNINVSIYNTYCGELYKSDEYEVNVKNVYGEIMKYLIESVWQIFKNITNILKFKLFCISFIIFKTIQFIIFIFRIFI
jgi:hypothetical protein